jgi:hypothetical protein
MNYTEEQIRNMDYVDRRELALNTNTPLRILKTLAQDKNWDVRRYVAANPNTPIEILRKLAKDKNRRVRKYAATNPNSTERILVSVFEYERSQKNQDKYVFKSIISNANCPDYLKAVIQTVLEEMK